MHDVSPVGRIDGYVRTSCPDLHPEVLVAVTEGKRLRSRLMMLVGGEAVPAGVAAAVEMAHLATLLHDDVLDEQMERRGRPTAHLVLGNRLTILEGDILLAGATTLVASHGIMQLLAAFTAAVMATCEGEILQGRLYLEGRCSFPEYRKAIRGKTGALFGFAGFAGGWFLGGETAARSFRNILIDMGELYQLHDDLQDVDEDAENLFLTYPKVLLAEALGREMFMRLPPEAWAEQIALLGLVEVGKQQVALSKLALLDRLPENALAERLGVFIEAII